jgi:hypothetical protein
MKAKLLLCTIAATLMVSAIGTQPAKARVPMLITYDEGQWTLDVPDADTTASAYGGRLRLYDVHIATMVEVTYQQCVAPRRDNSPEDGSRRAAYDWSYRADYGRADMGTFTITCELAQNLVMTYGLGEPTQITMRGEVESAVMGYRTNMIPNLDITGEETDQWMDFTSHFKPYPSEGNG